MLLLMLPVFHIIWYESSLHRCRNTKFSKFLNLFVIIVKHLFKKTVLINEWHYFQPARDSGVNNKNVGSNGTGYNNNNESGTIGTSNYQGPNLSCTDETKDQEQQSQQQYMNYQQRQHKQSENHNYIQMPQPENQHQQHQV